MLISKSISLQTWYIRFFIVEAQAEWEKVKRIHSFKIRIGGSRNKKTAKAPGSGWQVDRKVVKKVNDPILEKRQLIFITSLAKALQQETN